MKIIGKMDITETDDGKLLVRGESATGREIDPPQVENPTIINGAWYLDSFPGVVVAEMADNSLRMFRIAPFRVISEADLQPYKGYHPRKMKGQPLPDYLYRFYGLARCDETMSEVVRVRMTPTEKAVLDTYADGQGKTVSEAIRDWVRSL